MLVLALGLFSVLSLVDTGNKITAKTVKRDAGVALLREVTERARGLTFQQLTAANAGEAIRVQMERAGATTTGRSGTTFDVTRGATAYLVTIASSVTRSTTCGTVDAPPGTILVVGPGACGYPADGTPTYHGPTGEASGCKVGIEPSPGDLSSGAVGLRVVLLSRNVSLCTASLLGQATANAVCSMAGQSGQLTALLRSIAGRDGLLRILGAGTLGINVDFCNRSGTTGYVANPPKIDLSAESATGPETAETRATVSVSWETGRRADGTQIRSRVDQTTPIRQSTAPGQS